MPHIINPRSAALVLVLLGLSPAGAVAQQNQPQNPSNAYYEFLLARRLEGEGDSDRALAALQRAAAADPTSAEIKAEIAGLYLRRDPRPRADVEKAAKEALALDPANVEAHRTLGTLYSDAADAAARAPSLQAAQDVRSAIEHLERAVAGTIGTDLQMHFRLAQMYLRNSEPEKVVQSLTRVVVQNPAIPQLRTLLANAHALSGNLKGAIATLSAGVDYSPALAADLARYLEQDGQLREAAAAYTLALAQNPNNRQLKVQRILALFNAREFSQAAGFAGEARKQHPEEPAFPRLQARALFEGGDRSAAIAVAEAAAKSFPKDLQTQLNLASLYSNAGRATEAISIAETANKTFPRDRQAQFALVDAYADAGRSTDAERVLRQMLASEPTDARVLNHLGYLLANRGEQLDEAVSLVRRALAADPDRPEYLDSLGWAHFKRGELNDAVKYLTAAAEKLPTNSEVQDHLGDVHAQRGSTQEAIAAWTRALEGDGQGIEKASVEKKIANAKIKMQNGK